MDVNDEDLAASKSNQVRWFAWVVWGLGALFFFYEFLLQIVPGVMSTDLMRDFNVTANHFGLLVSFYFVAYASMQLPAGVLLDRFGPRRLLAVAALLCSVGTLMFGTAQHYAIVELARFITGLGSAFAMLGTLVLVANWFPTNRFASIHGITLTIGMLGAVFGSAPMSMLVEHYQWRPSLIGLGIIGLVITASIWLIVRDKPTYSVNNQRANSEPVATADVLRALGNILKHKQSWLIALFGILIYAPTAALGQWGPIFIQSSFDVDLTKAAAINSTMFIGWCVGSPFFGALSDRIGRRKVPLYISAVGTLICLVGIIYLPMSLTLLTVMMFAFGFFTCGFVPSFSLIRELHPPKASGTALGFMNMINSLGGAIAAPAIGILLDWAWDGKILNRARVYSAANYHLALNALPILVIIALLILPMIKETYCQTAKHA